MRTRLFPNVAAGGLYIVVANGLSFANVPVADKGPILVIVAGREGANGFT